MNNGGSKNDNAWKALFEKYDILNAIDKDGQFLISADQIREFREPRLMAKFDHKINLPQLFSKNNLAILPVSRGDYVISHFQSYKQFESLDTSIVKARLPSFIQSLDPHNIPSEAIAINCALASGILSDFLEEEILTSTVSGRMSSDRFSFKILNSKTNTNSLIEVRNSQIEIDAAFEGIYSLSLIEAKRDVAEDFLIRQLYYPFRTWTERVSKCVRPVFLVYTNGIFSLYEYEFSDMQMYNSLTLIKQKNYSIEDIEIEMSDIVDIFKSLTIISEPKIPFPQADKFERLINLCELLSTQELSRDEVTEKYAFDIRQTNYYTDAGRYLNLIDKKYDIRKPLYGLTDIGRKIMSLPYKQRQLELCKCILQHRAFYKTFECCLDKGEIPIRGEIINIMKSSNLFKVDGESTYYRRASTVNSWISWILELLK